MQSNSIEKEDFDLATCFEKGAEGCYKQVGEGYFDGYSHFSIHEEMLKDRVRTETYERAIMTCPALLKDKIVLDVGCGTGILSIFAARAGAKHVYAVDNANIVHQAREIIEANGFKDKITVIQGKVENVTLPVQQVDVIISEWMGYFLLYESMLDTVLFARDKWLSPEGQLFPDRAAMYIASLEDEEYRGEKVDFWDNVYDVDMSCVKKQVLHEPLVDTFDSRLVNSNACCILDIDLKTVTIEQLQFANQYSLKVSKKDTVHALASWFDTFFSFTDQGPLTLSTSPFETTTHWKQVVFYLEKPLPVYEGDSLHGSIAVKKNT